jgi:hypothetical protein
MNTMDNRKLFILVIAFIVLFSGNFNVSKQSVVNMDTCYEKEDCKLAVSVGFCDVKYDCVSGECYTENIRCKEICNDMIDNDYDKYYDCKDSDCATTNQCPCQTASFESCRKGGCYCASGTPKWVIYPGGANDCICG